MSFLCKLKGYRLILTKQVEKSIASIDSNDAKKILIKLEELVLDIGTHDIKKLVDYKRPTFRMRWGHYRVIFEIREEEVIVLVIKLAHRKDVYRD